MSGIDPLTLGVEEEFLLVDPDTFELRPGNDPVLRRARRSVGEDVQPELFESQVELATPICHTLQEVELAVRERRGALAAGAADAGCRLVAMGTHPFASWKDHTVTHKDRYEGLISDFQQIARETMICGMHVHVGLPDAEDRIEVMNRVRPWLSVLLALSVNSPYWDGADSGYASYRTEVFRRWPTNLIPRRFAGWADYEAVVDALVSIGMVEDASKLYWDVRPSARFPTLEFRVGDVCLTTIEAVTLAGLVRALAMTALADARAGTPPPDPLPEVLEAASWRAARDGCAGELVDPVAARPVPAAARARSLLDTVNVALDATGDRARVTAGVEAILSGGTGADRQRAAGSTDDLGMVVRMAAEETLR